MTKESLLKQMARAERLAKNLAKNALDALTVNRLESFAAQCRDELHGVRRTGAIPASVGLPVSRNDLCLQGEDR